MREIEIKNKAEKEVITTINEFLMEHALEHARDKKCSLKLTQKINLARK